MRGVTRANSYTDPSDGETQKTTETQDADADAALAGSETGKTEQWTPRSDPVLTAADRQSGEVALRLSTA